MRQAVVAAVLTAETPGSFETRAVAELPVTFGGAPGDVHFGVTKGAGTRESMYPRGETVFNRRQLTVVGEEELTAVAQRLGLRELRPEWIGANLVLRGDPDLTLLPAGARLLFAGGVGLLSLGENLPCTKSGAAVAAASGRPEVASLFAREAVGRRGLICIVERAGVIRAGEVVELYPPRPTRRPW